MNPRVAFPFLVLPETAIVFNGWLVGDPGQPLQPAGEILENWDYATNLEVATGVTIDWRLVSQRLQLPLSTLKLRVVLTAGTGSGSLPRRQARIAETIVDQSLDSAHLGGVLPGKDLSGRLRLSLMVTLAAPCNSGTQLSPKLRCSRLWSSQHDILIEDGGDSRFPIEAISFSQAFKGRPHEQAPWYLHWRPDALQLDFSGGVRLYLNSDRPELVDRVSAGDGLVLQAIMGDVVSQMVAAALDQEEALERIHQYEEGSVGSQIKQWLDLGFPGQEAASVRVLRDQKPGAFRGAILAASDMGRVET